MCSPQRSERTHPPPTTTINKAIDKVPSNFEPASYKLNHHKYVAQPTHFSMQAQGIFHQVTQTVAGQKLGLKGFHGSAGFPC